MTALSLAEVSSAGTGTAPRHAPRPSVRPSVRMTGSPGDRERISDPLLDDALLDGAAARPAVRASSHGRASTDRQSSPSARE